MINSADRKAGPFTGNGSTTVFPFEFKVFTAADLLVVLASATGVETTQVITTNYTVSLNADQEADPGGDVTMVVAPPVGTSLVVTSSIENLQSTDIQNLGGFYPEVIENALDRNVIQIQQVAEVVARALVLPRTVPDGVSAQLPAPAASRFLGWNGTADALVNFDGVSEVGVSSYMASVVAALNAAGARALLLAAQSGANADITSLSGLLTINGGSVEGRLIGVQVFTSGGTYTPTPGTTSVVAEVQAGGGAGGGAGATGAGQVDVGAGGAAGGYAMSRLTSGFSGVAVTVGAGGVATAGASGGAGDSSSFGGLLSATGGAGGLRGGVLTMAVYNDIQTLSSGAPGAGVGGNIVNLTGGVSTHGIYLTRPAGGIGGPSKFGGGGRGATNIASPGFPAANFGAGGGGAGVPASTAAYAGGDGKHGVVIVWEYA